MEGNNPNNKVSKKNAQEAQSEKLSHSILVTQ